MLSTESYCQESSYQCPDLPLGIILNLDNQDQILYTQEEYRQALLLFSCSRELSLNLDSFKKQNKKLIQERENLLDQKEALETKFDTLSRELDFNKMMRESDKELFDKRLKAEKKDKIKIGIITAVSGCAVGIITGIILTLVISK